MSEKLGSTGNFPLGQKDAPDESELQMAITVDSDLDVRIDFGKPVHWFAMTPEQALEFARLIVMKADEAQHKRYPS